MNTESGKSPAQTDIAMGPPPAPLALDEHEAEPLPNIRSDAPSAMEVFFAWEKLRLIYNGVLILIVLVMCGPAVIFIWSEALLSALAANLMFCAGPVGECYLCWLGVPRVIARWVLFAIGMLIAIGVTMLAADEALRNLPQWP